MPAAAAPASPTRESKLLKGLPAQKGMEEYPPIKTQIEAMMANVDQRLNSQPDNQFDDYLARKITHKEEPVSEAAPCLSTPPTLTGHSSSPTTTCPATTGTEAKMPDQTQTQSIADMEREAMDLFEKLMLK